MHGRVGTGRHRAGDPRSKCEYHPRCGPVGDRQPRGDRWVLRTRRHGRRGISVDAPVTADASYGADVAQALPVSAATTARATYSSTIVKALPATATATAAVTYMTDVVTVRPVSAP